MDTPAPRTTPRPPTSASAADLAREVAEVGSAVLRDAWPSEQLERLRGAVVGFCERRAELVATGMAAPRIRQYHEQGSVVLNWLLMEGRIDLEFFAELFTGSLYHELCKAYFDDDRFYMAPERIGFRNMQPPHSARSSLPYHQDSYTQDPRVLGVLNCWVPLNPGAGRTAPGVEVIRAPGRPKFELKDFGAAPVAPGYDAISIDRDRIVAEYGENFLAPEFEVGDALVFSENVIHRTFVTPEMTEPRIGFEFRVFSLKRLAPWASVDEVESESFPLVLS